MSEQRQTTDLLIVGGGPAGYTAAIFAARRGLSVRLFDHSRKPLQKLRITGKGRCNLTNNCTVEQFLENVPRGSKFLRSSYSRFTSQDIMAFFESLGVPLKTERGRRVYPQSERADDIAEALLKEAKRLSIQVESTSVRNLWIEDGKLLGIRTASEAISGRSVLLCTGGKSYPATGSDGSGYALAQQAGHTVSPLMPSLVSVRWRSPMRAELAGLSLKNVRLKCSKGKKTLMDELGELLFTHEGVSGPLVLTLSSLGAFEDFREWDITLDLKPGLDWEQLDHRLLRDFSENANRQFKNALDELLPKSLIPVVIQESKIPGELRVNQVTAEQRKKLLHLLKEFPMPLGENGPYEEAVVTAGGVLLKEVNPKTMASKCLPGLYLAGELLDADGLTGGYNLTIAFCTGHAAGISILEDEEQ